MKISSELKDSLDRASQLAVERRHEFITPEHILHAFLSSDEMNHLLHECGADVDTLKRDLESFFEKNMKPIPKDIEFQIDYSMGSRFIIRFASLHVQSSGREILESSNVLIAMFRDKESHAVYFLEKQGVSRLNVIKYISHGTPKIDSSQDNRQDVQEKKEPLKDFCVQLNEQAKQGKLDPLVGRSEELDRTIHILARRKKNNPIFVGDAGVGKTAIVEGLAQLIVKGEVPKPLRGLIIYSLNMGVLMSGTRFRGDFEERLNHIVSEVKAHKNYILFIDEIHTVIGAGAVTGGALDASNMLKPALAGGEIRCIGTTTFKEYRSIFEKDHALARRFQRINVHEPSEDDSIKILNGLKKYYEKFHGVRYSQAAIRASVELSAKHITDRRLPDKALDIIDEAGAALKLRQDPEKDSPALPKNDSVSSRDIENLVSKIARIPPKTIKSDDKYQLKNLEPELTKVIFGQSQAIRKLTTAIQLSRAGLKEDTKPIGSFLFAGPTGVGKTELAKQLAAILGVELVRFDMSEYMEKHTVSRLIGSPPGYVGFEQGGHLTEAVSKSPHSVLLFDEIEKAHEDIYNILLQVMDYASLTDTSGRKIDFRQVILIMTTNQGAREGIKKAVGFDEQSSEEKSYKAIERHFSPEFRNRITGIVLFKPLNQTIVKQVVKKILSQLEEKLKTKKIKLKITEKALDYLAKKGYDPQMGARPIERLIESEVSEKLAGEILFGGLTKGSTATITLKKNQIVVQN